jgi:hypothetical protein
MRHKDAPIRTDTDVNLSAGNLRCNQVDGGEARRALTVDSRNGGGDWNTGMKGSHTSPIRTAARRENISHVDVLNERRIEVDLGVNGTKGACK